MGERNVLRADIVASTAADAHVISISLLVIQDLVQHLEPHPFSILLPVTAAACHIGEAIHHTGSPNSAPFADLGILRVVKILLGKAGAGRTDKIAATAIDATLVVLLPHGSTGNLRREVFGNADLDLILMHLIRY